MTRMARLGNFLKEAFTPQGAGAGAKAFDLAMSYGPDLAFAGLAAGMAPGGFNAGVGAEDLAISLLGSSLGRVSGRYAGQRLFNGDPDAMGRASQAADLLISAPLQIAAPRPVLNAAIENELRSQKAQEQAAAEHQQMTTYEQLANALLTTGGMVNPGLYV